MNSEILADHTGFFTLKENLPCNFSSKDFPLSILILPFRIDLEHEINENDNYEHELCELLAIIFVARKSSVDSLDKTAAFLRLCTI